MQVIDWSPEELGIRASYLPSMLATKSLFAGDPLPDPEPSFLSAAVSTFERENLAWNALKAIGRSMNDHGAETVDPSWNPYAYMRTQWEPEKYRQFLPYIAQGLFDDAMTPEMVQAKASAIEEERQLIQAAEGSFTGALAGGLAAAIADPTTYIPVGGWLMTGGRLLRVGKLALHGAATGLLQEAGLHQFQDLRTVRESVMNIGSQAALAGAFGTLGYGAFNGHALHPGNPNNPFHPENLTRQGVVTRVVGEGEDVLSHVDSVGAARVPGTEDFTGNAPGRGGSSTALGRFVMGWTPAGRALEYTSDTARSVLVRLMDLGGVYTDTNRFGVRTAHSAEDLKRDYFANASRLELGMERIIRETRQALGDVDAPRIDAPQFHEVTRLMLKGMYEDADRANLEAAFGPRAVPIIEGKAREAAESIHETNAVFETKLVEHGFLRDERKVSALRDRIKTLNDTRDKALEPLQAEATALRGELAKAERRRSGNPARASEIKTRLGEIETKMSAIRDGNRTEALKEELQRQMSLPSSLGRDYGHAQLWDRATIAENPAEFEQFLREVLASKPDEGWLMEAYGLTAKELENLKTVEVERYRDILQQWSGDEYYHRLSQAESILEVAQHSAKQTQLDLNETLRSLGMVKKGEALAELSEARKFRDRFQVELATRRAKRDQVRAEYEALTSAAEAARTQTLTRRLEPLVSPVDAKALVASQERAKVLARDLRRADGEVAALERRLSEVEEAYRVSAERLEKLKAARESLEAARKAAESVGRVAATELRKATSGLASARKATPLDVTIEEIKRALMDRNELPTAIMDRVVPESGRMKARRLILTKEQERVAADRGYLRTDLPNILHAQYDQLAGHIGIREALEIGEGKRFASWGDIENAVSREYDDLVSQAAPADRPRLNAERDKVLSDMRLLKGRLIGLENLGTDRDGWLAWGSAKMRQANFIRYGSGFLLTSLTDVATLALRTKLLPTLVEHSEEALRIMRAMDREDLRVFVNAAEFGGHGVALARRLGTEDTLNRAGIGVRGTLKNTITAHVDVAASKLSDVVSTVSGLPYWNTFLKITAGLAVSHRLRNFVLRYDGLTDFQRADLASLGIGRVEAERLKGFIERHGVEKDGKFDPNLEAWLKEPEGEQAARDFRIAVQREMTRAINTPGIGDTPAIMDSWFGKLALQFQTFAFTFMNRYVTPTAQRMVDYRDMRALASLGVLAFSSYLVMLGKDIINGRNPEDRLKEENLFKTTQELVDRSGLLGWMSPYVDGAFKLLGITSSTRFARNSWMESLGGINLALLGDVQRLGSSIAEGEDGDKLMKKAMALAPFSTHIRLFHELIKDH